jgi:hypothetical protein
MGIGSDTSAKNNLTSRVGLILSEQSQGENLGSRLIDFQAIKLQLKNEKDKLE